METIFDEIWTVIKVIFGFLADRPNPECCDALYAYLAIIFAVNFSFVAFREVRDFFYDKFDIKFLRGVKANLKALQDSKAYEELLNSKEFNVKMDKILDRIEEVQTLKYEVRVRITLKIFGILFSCCALFLLMVFGFEINSDSWLQPKYWPLVTFFMLSWPIPIYVLFRMGASWWTKKQLKKCEVNMEKALQLNPPAVKKTIRGRMSTMIDNLPD